MNALFLPQWQAYLRYLDLPGMEPACVYLAGLGLAATAAYPRTVASPGLATRRSIMVDWFGCGYSDRPENFDYSIQGHAATIAALLEHLDLKACTVIGHSMGGAVAIVLASQWPDLVGRLVLAEANLDAGGGMLSRSIATQSEADFVSRGRQQLLQQLRADAINGDVAAAVVLGIAQLAAPFALYRTAVSLVQGMLPGWREQLYQLPVPRAFLFGERSLPDGDADLLPAQGIRVAVVPRAAHGMMIENPEGFAGTLMSVIGE